MISSEERKAVVKEAITWLGTPFHNNAAIKGAGVDCASIISESFNRALNLSLSPRIYTPQWFLHSREEIYIKDLLAAGFVETIAVPVLPADVIVSRVGRLYCHAALVINWPIVIHAESRGNKVVFANAYVSWYFAGRESKIFRWGAWVTDRAVA